jgi:hypothetical protein
MTTDSKFNPHSRDKAKYGCIPSPPGNPAAASSARAESG